MSKSKVHRITFHERPEAE